MFHNVRTYLIGALFPRLLAGGLPLLALPIAARNTVSPHIATARRPKIHRATIVRTAQPYVWRNVTITAGGFITGLRFSPAQRGLLYARTDIGGAYRWDGAGRKWIPLNDWAGGKDANLLGCESLGIDPTDPKRLYMAAGTYTQSWATNGAMLRSKDQGRTWQRTDMPFKMGGNEDGRSMGERLAVDPNQNRILFFGSRHNGLWRSGDFGATWTQVPGFPAAARPNSLGIGFVVFDRASGRCGAATPVIYAGTSDAAHGLYRSRDGGETWAAVAGQPTGLMPHQGATDASGTLYVTYGDGPGPNGMINGAVWKYNTQRDAWTDITPVKPGNPSGFGYAGLALDAQHAGTLMVSTMDRWNPGDDLFRSTDGGISWKPIRAQAVLDPSHSPWLKWGNPAPRFGWWIGALAIDPFAPGHVLYGTGATIWGSDDANRGDAAQPTHWSVRADGLEETAVQALISPPEGAHLLSALGDIGGFRHDDLNATPPQGMYTNPIIDNLNALDYAENKSAIVVRVGRGDHGRNGALSRNGGNSWTPFASAPEGSRGEGSIALSADGATLVWAARGSAVSVSRDGGTTWSPVQGVSGANDAVLADRAQPNVFYARHGNTLFISRDSAATFASVGTLPEGTRQIRATPGRAGDLWLTAGKGGVYHSTDSGATWKAAGSIPEAGQIGFGKAASGQSYPALYLTGETDTGEAGVFRSDNAGQNWVRINDAKHQYGYSGQAVTGDPRIYGRVYVGSNGRGIFYADPVSR